jgi:hypothetical protein
MFLCRELAIQSEANFFKVVCLTSIAVSKFLIIQLTAAVTGIEYVTYVP